MLHLLKARSAVAAALALSFAFTGFAGCKKQQAAGDAPVSAMAPMKTPGGAASPEALVERMKKAAENENMAEVVACLAPRARQDMSAAMYLGATMMVAFSQMGSELGGAMMEGMGAMAEGMGGKVSDGDKQKADEQAAAAKEQLGKLHDEYNKLMKKHGLPQMPKEGEAAPAEPTKEEMDRLFANLDHGVFVADVMVLLDSMPGENKPSGSPVDMKEGNLENLKIEGDRAAGTVGGDEVKFIRIEERWYLDAEPMLEPAAESSPPAEDSAVEAKPGI